MQSSPEPVAVFESYEAAYEYGKGIGFINEEKDAKLEKWQLSWEIKPIKHFLDWKSDG